MRSRGFGRILLILFGGAAGVLTMTGTHAQPTPAPGNLPNDLLTPNDPLTKAAVPAAVRPVSTNPPAATKVTPPQAKQVPFDRFRNSEALPAPTRTMVRSAQIGMEWLYRYHQANGKFLHGYLPAVNQAMDGDHPLRQAMATFTLARAARFIGDERYLARAEQAVLTLLSDTMVIADRPGVRIPAQKSILCNRLAMAGFLVMAINELPDPAPDLLAKSEELCAFIRGQQRSDGSLGYTDLPEEGGATLDPDGVNHYPGPALFGLMLSQRHKPADWKTATTRKAIGHYQQWFRDHPNPAMIAWMTAACCEAYERTRENLFYDFAFRMNDWIVGAQYEQLADPNKRSWLGGFMGFDKGKFAEMMPTIESAGYAQALADCCRMIHRMPTPDTQRYDRYRNAVLHAALFLSTLQFTEANTLHIASNYRGCLVGGFHPAPIDGNLRIDQSAAGVSAMIEILMSGVDRP